MASHLPREGLQLCVQVSFVIKGSYFISLGDRFLSLIKFGIGNFRLHSGNSRCSANIFRQLSITALSHLHRCVNGSSTCPDLLSLRSRTVELLYLIIDSCTMLLRVGWSLIFLIIFEECEIVLILVGRTRYTLIQVGLLMWPIVYWRLYRWLLLVLFNWGGHQPFSFKFGPRFLRKLFIVYDCLRCNGVVRFSPFSPLLCRPTIYRGNGGVSTIIVVLENEYVANVVHILYYLWTSSSIFHSKRGAGVWLCGLLILVVFQMWLFFFSSKNGLILIV